MALMGPFVYMRHLISGSRLPFTAAYFGSIALTLYFAIGVSSPSYIHIIMRSIPIFFGRIICQDEGGQEIK